MISGLTTRLWFIETNDLYTHSAYLTPKYRLKWLKPSEKRSFDKEALVRSVENFILKRPVNNEIDKINYNNDLDEPHPKRQKLIKFYECLL